MPNEFRVKRGLIVEGSGSNVVIVDGVSGRLFAVNDSFSGSLFSVNTVAGLPVIEAFSDNTVRIGQFGSQVIFVSQSRVGIGKESALGATLDVSGSSIFTGSLSVSGSVITQLPPSISTGNFTVALSSSGRFIEVSSSNAVVITVPDNSSVSFEVGSQIMFAAYTKSSVSFTTGSNNVFLRSSGNRYRLLQQYSAATLIKRSTNEWYLIGDLGL